MGSWKWLLSILVLALCCRADRSSLQLGVVLPLTGEQALLGEQARRGVELALDEANRTGGIAGSKVRASFQDSQGDSSRAASAMLGMIREHHVQIIIGDLLSGPTLAMAPIAEAHRVVLVTPSASAATISAAGRYIFRLGPLDSREVAASAGWAITQGFHTAAIVFVLDRRGDDQARVFRESFSAAGRSVVSSESFGSGTDDLRPILLPIRAKHPDVIFLTAQDSRQVIEVVHQARGLGIESQFLAAGPFLPEAESGAEGLMVARLKGFDEGDPTPTQRQFRAEFRERFRAKPDWFAAHAYDAATMVLEGLRSGARTGEEVRAFLDHRREFQGASGRILLDDNGDDVGKAVLLKVFSVGGHSPPTEVVGLTPAP
ncbi:MAG TPA: penicillin-binding protein activator [Thermoanaerobaculia bacterium]|jgi:branched-chain amino acid transport system substrate-binding protein|nr:penicillin-binding protein activator [Thermoanaerobaculia bacterium]